MKKNNFKVFILSLFLVISVMAGWAMADTANITALSDVSVGQVSSATLTQQRVLMTENVEGVVTDGHIDFTLDNGATWVDAQIKGTTAGSTVTTATAGILVNPSFVTVTGVTAEDADLNGAAELFNFMYGGSYYSVYQHNDSSPAFGTSDFLVAGKGSTLADAQALAKDGGIYTVTAPTADGTAATDNTITFQRASDGLFFTVVLDDDDDGDGTSGGNDTIDSSHTVTVKYTTSGSADAATSATDTTYTTAVAANASQTEVAEALVTAFKAILGDSNVTDYTAADTTCTITGGISGVPLTALNMTGLVVETTTLTASTDTATKAIATSNTATDTVATAIQDLLNVDVFSGLVDIVTADSNDVQFASEAGVALPVASVNAVATTCISKTDKTYLSSSDHSKLVVDVTASAATSPSRINIVNMKLNTSSSVVGTDVKISTDEATSTSSGYTPITDLPLCSVNSLGATVSLTAGSSVATISPGSSLNVPSITVKELIPGSFTDSNSATDEITLDFPSGFNINTVGSISTPGTTVAAVTPPVVDSVVTSQLDIDVTNTASSSSTESVVWTGGKIFVPNTASAGELNVTATIKLSNGTTFTATLKVADIVDKGTINSFVEASGPSSAIDYNILFAGRDYTGGLSSTPGVENDKIKISETAPGTISEGGTLSLTLDSGVTFGSTANTVITETNVNLTPGNEVISPATNPVTATYTMGAASSAAGSMTFAFNDLDLTSATAGDLNVTIGGTAGVTAGTIKLAEIVEPTETTVSGSIPVSTAGSNVTLPTIQVVEAQKGVIADSNVIAIEISGATFLDKNNAGMTDKANFDLSTNGDFTVTVLDGSGTDVTSACGITATAQNGAGAAVDQVVITVTTGSDAKTAGYTYQISGLKVKLPSGLPAGNVNATLASSKSTDANIVGDDDATDWTSLRGMKKATVKVAQIVSSSVPNVSSAVVADGIATCTITPAGNDTGKLGDVYVVAKSGTSKQYYDGSAWSDTETPYIPLQGVNLAQTDVSFTVADLAAGTKVYVGYGVGFDDTYSTMNSNGTIGLAYTVIADVNVDKTEVSLAPEATATVTIADGVAPYTIVSDTEAVATVSVTTLDAAGSFDITGVADGTATITVTDSSTPAKKATVAVTVAAPVPALTVSNTALTLEAADATATFDVTGGTAPYTVVSSDETVATIDPAELTAEGAVTVTAVANGIATITVADSSDPAKTAEVAVTVTIPVAPPVDVEINTPAADATAEEFAAFVATAPVDMGSSATGGTDLGITVGFPAYTDAVDIWVAVMMPDGTFLFVNENGELMIDDGSYPVYAAGVKTAPPATIVDSFKVCNPLFHGMLKGTWSAYWVVAPAVEGASLTDALAAGKYELGFYSFDVNCD